MPFNKPTSLIDWMPSNTVEVPPEKATTGWIAGEEPAFQYFNAIFQNFSSWHKFVNNNFTTGPSGLLGIGDLALSGSTGIGSVALGDRAGSGQGSSQYTVSVGEGAGQNAIGDGNVSLGASANASSGAPSNKQHLTGVGRLAGFGASGDGNTFVGHYCGALAGGSSQSTIVGKDAFSNWVNDNGSNPCIGTVVMGARALTQAEGAGNKVETGTVHIGFESGNCSGLLGVTIGGNRVCVGSFSGSGSTGSARAVMLGSEAGMGAENIQDTVTLGYRAGKESSGKLGVYIGTRAGRGQLGDNVIAIGEYACATEGEVLTTQTNSTGIFIGRLSGSTSTLKNGVVIGTRAGFGATGDRSIYLGNMCGYLAVNSIDNIAIGGLITGSPTLYAGGVDGGIHSVFIGTGSGAKSNADYIIALGYGSGIGTKSVNPDTIAIGRDAGRTADGVGYVGSGIFIGKNQGKNLDAGSGIEANPLRIGVNSIGDSLLHGAMDTSGSIQNQYLRINGMLQIRSMTSTELEAWQAKFVGDLRSGMIALNSTTNQLWVSSNVGESPVWLKFTPDAIDAW